MSTNPLERLQSVRTVYSKSANIERKRSLDRICDTFEHTRPVLRRNLTAPAVLPGNTTPGRCLLDALQIVPNAASEIVTAVQAQRTDLNMPLLSDAMAMRLEDVVRKHLKHNALLERMAQRLDKQIAIAMIQKLTRFFTSEQGTFYRDRLLPLAHEFERARLGWQAQRAAGVPKPRRPGGERRAQIERAIPLVVKLRPAVQGDDGLCDVLAGLLLFRLDHAGRRSLRHYLHGIERESLKPVLDQISAWVLDTCSRDGTFAWVLGEVDALADLEACDRAIAKNSKALPPLRRRAELYLENLEDPAMALRDMKRLVKLKPCADHHVARARVYIRLKDWSAALADLDEAMRLEPRHAGAYGWRSIMRLEQQNIVGAARDLRRGERRDGQDPDVCRAKLKLEEHRLSERLREHPEDAQAYIDRAQCRGKQSRYADALTDCRAALALSPHNPHALAGCDLWSRFLTNDGH